MKKTIFAIMVFITATVLCSCGGNKPTAENIIATEAQPAQTEPSASLSGSSERISSAVVNDGSKVGVLQEIPEQGVMKINGMIVNTGSGIHDYESIETLYAKGYRTEGLNSEYELNEWIELYADTDEKGFAVYVTKNDPEKDYSGITVAELEKNIGETELPHWEIGDEGADKDNYGFIGSFYIHPEGNDPGLYNVFFTKGDKAAYMLQLMLIPEKTE